MGTPHDKPAATPSPPRASLSPDYQRDWPAYYDAVTGKPPRDTLLRALARLTPSPDGPHRHAPRAAIDIACGEGRDTRAILSDHPAWRVLAVDASPDGLRRLCLALSPGDRARVDPRALAMESIPTLLAGTPAADLVNASFALPFCSPDAFPALWAWIRQTMRPGGVFAGQFFGDRDEWAPIRPRSHHSRPQVLALLGGLDVVHLEEVEKDGDDAMGGAKHHHVFHVVAARPAT